MHRNKYPILHLPQGTPHSHPDHDHPHGTRRLKDPQSTQIPADAAEYSSLRALASVPSKKSPVQPMQKNRTL